MIKNLSPDSLLKLSTVIFDIKHLVLYAKEGESVIYPSDENMNSPPLVSSLTSQEQRFFVFTLQSENAINVLHEHTLGRRETPFRWTLEGKMTSLHELDSEISQIIKSLQNEPSLPSRPSSGVGVVVSDLESKFQEIVNEKNDTNFYLKVAGYGKYLNDSEVAHPILDQLYEASQSQITQLKISWVSFFESWKKYAKDLINTTDTAGIKDEGPLKNEIEEVRNFLNQPEPQFSDTDLPRYYHSYREIVLRFDKLGKKDLITEKHLDKNGNIKLFPEYNKVEMEWDKYKRIREISNWWAHYQISRLAYGIMGNQEEKTHYFKDDNEIDKLYKFEFEEISRNPSYSPLFIRRGK